MKLHKTSSTRVYEFGAWPEFIKYTREMPTNERTLSSDVSWVGCTIAKADEYADMGWSEGAAAARDFTDLLVNQISGMIERVDVNYDVHGHALDVSRYLDGEPECWQQFDTTLIETDSPRFLRLVINVGASAGVDSEIILRRGAVLCALVELLELSGTRCEIAIVDATGSATSRWYCSTVTVKQFDQPLDAPIVAYAMAHPSVLRVHLFRLYNTMPPHWCSLAYGAPMNVPLEQRGDLYMPCMRWREAQWETPESARQWVLDTLTKCGVKLKEGAR